MPYPTAILLKLACQTYYSNYKSYICSSLIILNSGLGLASYDEGVLGVWFSFSVLII
jgi:hypothetical protein